MKNLLFSIGSALLLISCMVYASEDKKLVSYLRSDNWKNIIQKTYPEDTESQLKLRGTLSMVSKQIAAQQPDDIQLELTTADIEELVWTLYPLHKKRTIIALGHILVEHQVSEHRTKNPADFQSMEELRLRFARKLIQEALGYPRLSNENKPKRITADVLADTLRAQCLTHPFLCYTNKSGELLYHFVGNHWDDVNGRKHAILQYVLNAGDSVNYKDKDGNTVLHAVIERYPRFKNGDKRPGIVQQLLEKGADLAIEHPEYGTGFDHIVNKATYGFAELTDGQKLIMAGVAFSPYSDVVPQLLNKYLSRDRQLSEQQIRKLSKLNAETKKEYLRMDSTKAHKLEKKYNKNCSIQ